MSEVNCGWPRGGERPTPRELGPRANSDSHQPKRDPEDTSAQDPALLSVGPPHLDASRPGLRTLLQQLPPQDSDERYFLALGEEELAELRLFSAQRRREALGQGVACLVPPKHEGHTCEKCKEPLRPGEYAVFTALAGKQRCWHQPCFACRACGQALIDLIYFYHDEHLYCGRHHAELLRPRCPACDQLIFSQRCTEAEGRRWHENHFCCLDCSGPLGGGRYALPGGGPCCPSCFESRYSLEGSSPGPALEGRAPPAAGCSPKIQTGRLGSSPEQESRAGDVTEAPKGWAQGRLETPRDPKEDALCPTCSSSSDSEPEGFFLGQRLPRPGETPVSFQAGDSDTSGKSCIVC
ncbi:prickle-like protein 4 isoform X1 [Dasypus novemcinctus]|uniref:prickle-like protein 4 isoform X1 n=1 Tax=Dasypus novemcinctus TaxID=9361 RepID=UPI00265F5D96|nr:prickle-like protein 4 isoform X1 [Dasypus novemcinctus]XP_012382361.2 prickle-like protein 4 isoform X1 [Dasypus novemcinctus]XP_012382362.2 prickle-like protein 4 isoform X1 [Dasypus novemcinctus]